MPDSNTPPSSASHEQSEHASHKKKHHTGKKSQNKAGAQHKKYNHTRKTSTLASPSTTQHKSPITSKLPSSPTELQEQPQKEPLVEQEENLTTQAASEAKEFQKELQEEAQQQKSVDLTKAEKEPELTTQKQLLSPQEKPASKAAMLKADKKRLTKLFQLFVSIVLLLFLSSSTFFLTHDLTNSYVYAYALNPNNGTILQQQNLKNQTAEAWFSNPILQQDQVEIAIQGKNTAQHYQLLRFSRGQTSISREADLNIAQTQPNLSTTSTGELISSGQQGLQVRQANGRLLWQKAANLPTKGAHRFQPVSDSTTLYSVQAAIVGEVVAYNLPDGTERWTQKLDENLEYTPPFVLDKSTLYIAGEHTIFALNSSNGQIRWQVPITARTLLSAKNGTANALLTAGAQGLYALNPDTGETLWRFSGQSNYTLTTAQFYQASLAQDELRGNIIYATGIRWDIPRVEEQAWLYAIDATTGKQLWTQQLAAGFMSGDSSRVFTPLIDQNRQNIIIQHQESAQEQHISAYSMSTGNLRWDTIIHSVRQTAPALLQIPGGTLFLFATANNSITALTTLPARQYLMLITTFLSLLCLILLWAPRVANSKHSWQITFSKLQKRTHHYLKRVRENKKNWKPLTPLISIGLLILLLLSITIGYRQVFSTTGAGIYQISAVDGSLQWQQTGQNVTLTGVDTAGSIRSQQGQHLQWLQVGNLDGTNWQTFASEGSIGLATIEAQTDTLLTTLTASKNQNYQFAANDPGYPNTLANLFILASFARKDGQLNWQRTIIEPQEQQQGTIVGADQRYVYISSLPVIGTGNTGTTSQLLAVNQHTGNIDWRIFGPSNLPTAGENERLFIQQDQLVWQIQHTIYLLDANSGQIEWQRSISSGSEDSLQIQHLVITSSGQIIIATRQQIYSIEQSSGNLLWTQAIPNTIAGIQLLTAGEVVLIITGNELQGYTAATHQLLWTQQLHGTLQNIISAKDDKQIYLSLQNNTQSKTVMILALTSRQGRVSWHYTVPEQSRQVQLLAAKSGRLLMSICETKGRQICARERLSMLDTKQGVMLWQTEMRAIRTIFLNSEESSIAFQTSE